MNNWDPSDDFSAVIDGAEVVTIERPGSPEVVAVAHALRRALTTREAEASGGKYTAADVVWHLPAGELSAPPRPGDRIIDAAENRWTVLEATRSARTARWRCVARNLAIVAGLDQRVTIQQADYAKGAAGAAEPTWIDRYTDVLARVQPVDGKADVRHGERTTARRFRITLAEETPIDASHRVVGPDGAVYRIIGFERPERIDELFVIDAESIAAEVF